MHRKFLRGNVLSGSSSGAAVLLFSHPFDYARTRLAADVGTSPKDREFRGFANCLSKSGKRSGWDKFNLFLRLQGGATVAKAWSAAFTLGTSLQCRGSSFTGKQ